MADGPVSATVMIWAVIVTAFAMPCLALAALMWRGGRHGRRAGARPPPRLSAKYRFRLDKLPRRSAQVTPMAPRKGKRKVD